MKENINLSKYSEIKRIYENCIKEDVNERPTISELLLEFFINFCSEIQKENIFKYQEEYFNEIYNKYVIQTLKSLPGEQIFCICLIS